MASTLRALTLVVVLVLVWADDHNHGHNMDPQIEDLKKIHQHDLHKTEGSWVLKFSVSDGLTAQDLIRNLTSQKLTLHLLNNQSLHYDEKNFFRHQQWNCSHFVLNATAVEGNNEHDFHLEADKEVVEYEGKEGSRPDNITISFYQSCEHCLHMVYKSTHWGNFFLAYKREGHHRDEEQKEKEFYMKHAGSLGFPTEPMFWYDGHSEFCNMASPQAKH